MSDFGGCEAVPHERLVRVYYVHQSTGWHLLHFRPDGRVANRSDPYQTLEVCRQANKRYCDRIVAEIEERERRFGHRIPVELRSADLSDVRLESMDGVVVFEPKWLS